MVTAHQVLVQLRDVPWIPFKFLPQGFPAHQIWDVICPSTHHTSIHALRSSSVKGMWDGSKEEPPKPPDEAMQEVNDASTALIKIWDFFPCQEYKDIKKCDPPIDKIINHQGQSNEVS